MKKQPIIIIGSGLAGYMLAKELRKLDAQTPLQIITASDGRFYSKPQLSTALTANKSADMLAVNSAEQMAAQLNAEIRTQTRVTKIDPDKKVIFLGEEQLPYKDLVLACGADVIKAPLVGNAVDKIYSVNDLEDYALFRESLIGKKRIAILGAGLVGCEFANDLANVGHHVEIVAPATHPLETLLPFELGYVLQNALAENGVVWHLEQLATAMDDAASGEGYTLTLGYQQRITVDVVLSAIGLKPHVGLAESANLQIGRGILVNRYLQTSAPHIYALGDCAEVNGLVMLFVAPLLNCARALANTLANKPTAVEYPAMPVVIKTPVCPIVVCPPPRNLTGDWTISGIGKDLEALFHDEKKQLRGFALTGKAVAQRANLQKQLPSLFEEELK